MKLLVVTPTLGNSPWLGETVASVAVAGEGGDHEHVLVAPASAVAELRERFPRTTVIAEPVGGAGMYAAINAGATAGRAWHVMTYLNDDDVLLPRFSKVMQVAADAVAEGREMIVYGGVRLIDAKGRSIGDIPISRFSSMNPDLYSERLEPVFQHGTVVTRALWDRLGGFDAAFRYCGDSEFLARACVSGAATVCACGAAVAAFRLRAGQLTKNRAAMEEERARVDVKLRLLDGGRTVRRRWARLIFRITNLPVYAERVARHGFVTFDELLERGG